MIQPGGVDEPDLISTDLSHGPARLAPWMSALRTLPYRLASNLLATAAVAEGVRNGRFSQARSWARDRGLGRGAQWRLAVAVLANHGRFVGEEAVLGASSLDDLARNVTVLGAERLANLKGNGALLLGFHLGPPKTWLVLRALGLPVRFAGRLEAAARDERWARALDAGEAIRLPDGDAKARTVGLYMIRDALRSGALVYITGDGPFGAEAFRIDFDGGPVVIRSGWLAVRRAAGVPTFPVLTWREHGRRMIEIHPALPKPDPDPSGDVRLCRAALAPLLSDYVRRFPDQCRWVVMPRWPS
jgi:lauroyl/myristoyl acyltransferase